MWHREEKRAMELITSRAVELFLASLRTRSAPANIIKAYRLDLQQFLKQSPTALSEVTTDVIRTFLDSHEQHKPATRRRHAATLQAFYAWLMQQGLAQSNPMERLEPIGQIERLPRPLDPDDLSRILKAIPASNLRDRVIFTLLYETDMRVVQRLTVVENANFSPTHLTVPLTFLMLASCGVLPSPEFKQRGVVWPFTCSYLCSCSWSV
jgi:site-specific recombinase XerD